MLLSDNSTIFLRTYLLPVQIDKPEMRIDTVDVNPTIDPTHAFIVRIWIEHRESQNADPVWRGVIEHVKADKRVYFSDLDQLRQHFSDYLEELGIMPKREE